MHDVHAMHAMHDMHAMHGMHAMHAMPCYAMHVTQCNHLRVVPRELFGELPARIILCGQFPGSCSGNWRLEALSAGSSQEAVRGTADDAFTHTCTRSCVRPPHSCHNPLWLIFAQPRTNIN